MYGIMLGGDPEVFVVNTKTNKIVPPREFFKFAGEKLNWKIKDEKEGDYFLKNYYVYDSSAERDIKYLKEDNSQIELEINPTTCRDYIAFRYLKRIKKLTSVISKNPNWELSLNPVEHLPEEELENPTGVTHIFGCEPDVDAYSNGEKCPKVDPSKTTMRTIGAHLHFGIPEYNLDNYERYGMKENIHTPEGQVITPKEFENYEKKQLFQYEMNPRIAVIMDYFVGIPMMLLEGDDIAEMSRARRELYGVAGSFRSPKHGFEYRTLNSYVLTHNALLSYSYGVGRDIVYIAMRYPRTFKNFLNELNKVSPINLTQEAINTSNKELGTAIWEKVVPVYKSYLDKKSYIAKEYSISFKKKYNFFFDKIDYIRHIGVEELLRGYKWYESWEMQKDSYPYGMNDTFPVVRRSKAYWKRAGKPEWWADYPQFIAQRNPHSKRAQSLFPSLLEIENNTEGHLISG